LPRNIKPPRGKDTEEQWLRALVLHVVNTVTYSRAVTPAEAGGQYSPEDLDSRFYLKVACAFRDKDCRGEPTEAADGHGGPSPPGLGGGGRPCPPG
jgi:hypothetical protein